MICEKCKEKMIWKIDGSTQGWSCPECGWNVITSYISEINLDETEYSIYIEKPLKIETEKGVAVDNSELQYIFQYCNLWEVEELDLSRRIISLLNRKKANKCL